jgi:hypothetical protein
MSELKIPNLAGVITKADIDTKGTGSYAASYVNWAKVAHLLHEHAPGWDFRLSMAPDGGLLHQAPDGTAYVIGYFDGPEGEQLASFPFPCMDNRNNPIQMEKVSARILTDTHRRAMCACAAFSFGLAYELWAKDPVEDPHREEQAPKAAPAPAARAKRATTRSAAPAATEAPAAPAAAPAPAEPPAPAVAAEVASEGLMEPLPEDERQLCIQLLKDLKPTERNSLIVAFKAHFSLPDDALITQHITTAAARDFIQQQLTA